MHFVVGNTLLFTMQIIYRFLSSLEPWPELKLLFSSAANAAAVCLLTAPLLYLVLHITTQRALEKKKYFCDKVLL